MKKSKIEVNWQRLPTNNKEKFMEFPVEKDDKIVQLCSNGAMIELWNSKFGYDYTIKLVKNPKGR